MVYSYAKIQELIFSAIVELNATRESDAIEISTDTALYGQNSPLDSVDLVNLLITLEEFLEDEFDIEFTIASEKAMSQKNSPFRSVSTLAQYLEEALGEL